MGEQKGISMNQILNEVEESRSSPEVAEAIKAESGRERYGRDPERSDGIVVVTDPD